MTDLHVAAHVAVSRETESKIRAFADLLKEESGKQNLISASTLPCLWERHIIDSAQLARFAPQPTVKWVDIGSGPGLPGIVLAALFPGCVTLIEPRRLRAEFLDSAIDKLCIDARVVCAKSERVEGRFDVITARAVAKLDQLFRMAAHLSHSGTLWVLPKGRNTKSELEQARGSWHYDAWAEPSITDPESEILLLSNVRAKSR